MAVKWYLKSPKEVEDLLNTDTAAGLSRKAAALRFKREGENAVLKLPQTGIRTVVREFLHSFSFMLLFIVIFVAALRDSNSSTVTASIIFVIFIAAATICILFSKFVIYRAAERSIPQIGVIRQGGESYVDMRGVVRGDVVLLGEGDIVPCDIYITAAEGNLRVLEGRVTGVRAPSEKLACIISEEDVGLHERRNMLFAASIVKSGVCRGIAVETGKSCEVVRKNDQVPVFENDKPEFLSEIADFSQKIGVRLLIVSLFVIVIGFFRHEGGVGLFNKFYAAAALSAAAVSEMAHVIAYSAMAFRIWDGARAENSFLIKNISSIESVASLNTLVVKSDIFFGGGKYAAVAMCTADEKYIPQSSPAKSRGIRYFSECAAISAEYILAEYKSLKKSVSDVGEGIAFTEAVYPFVKGVADQKLHYTPLMSRKAGAGFAFDTVVLQGSKGEFAIASGGLGEILDCSNKYIDNGQIIPMESSARAKILGLAAEFANAGCKLVAYARLDFDYPDLESAAGIHKRMQFIGFVAIRRCTGPDAETFFVECRRRRIRHIILHDGKIGEIKALVGGIPLIADSSYIDGTVIAREGKSIDKNLLGYDIYVNLSSSQKEALITALSEQGRSVGVAADVFADYRMIFPAKVTLTRGISGDFDLEHSRTNAKPDVRCKSILRTADVITGDSPLSILNSIKSAVQIQRNISSALRYLVTMLLLRCLMVLIGVIFGVDYLSATGILFFSMIIDGCAIYLAFIREEDGSGRRQKITIRYWHEIKRDLVGVIAAIAAAAVVPAGFAVARSSLEVGEISAYTLITCALVSLEYILIFIKPIPGKAMLISFASILFIVMLILVAPPLSAAFGAVFSSRALLIALAIFALSAIAQFIAYGTANSAAGPAGKK